MSSKVVPVSKTRQPVSFSSEAPSSSSANNTKKNASGAGSSSAVGGGWNDRFAYGEPGILKQKELPKPPFPLTGMNGGEIKSSMRHLGAKRSGGQHNQHQRRKRAVDMATQTDDGDVVCEEDNGGGLQLAAIDVTAGRQSAASIPSFRLSSLKIDVTESIQCGNDGQHSKKDVHEMEGMIDRGLDGNINAAYPLCRLEMLGRGSSASVYKAVLLNTLTLCAEKVIVVADYSKRTQLLRELQSLKKTLVDKDGRTKCANVVSLLDIVPNPKDGTLSICLEYMDGGSLQDLVKMGLRQSERVIQGIAKQMLQGLQFLHSLRLIHRDLKPSNALISSAGVVKLADFGLARTLESGASLAESFCGTFDYMAPERMIGNAYSFHSDVWSLGLTVHTVAIGTYPYEVEKGGFWAILNAVQEQPIPLPSESEFSADFADFISKACAREPADRPTALQLLNHPFILSSPPGPINAQEIARKQSAAKEVEGGAARGRRIVPGKAGGVAYAAGVGGGSSSGIAGGGKAGAEQRGRRIAVGPRSRIPVAVAVAPGGSRAVRVSRSGDVKGSGTDSSVSRSRPRHPTAPGALRPPVPSHHARSKQSSPQRRQHSRSRSSSLTRGRGASLTRTRGDSSVSREPALTREPSVSFAAAVGEDSFAGTQRKPPLPSAVVGRAGGRRGRERSRSRSESNPRGLSHSNISSNSSSSSSSSNRGLGRNSVSDSSGDESNNIRQRGARFPRRNPFPPSAATTTPLEASHVTPAEARHIAQTWRDYAAAVSSSAVGRGGTFTIEEELSPALQGPSAGLEGLGAHLHPPGTFPNISPETIDALARQMCGAGPVEDVAGLSSVSSVLRKAFSVAVADLKEALSRAVMSEDVCDEQEDGSMDRSSIAEGGADGELYASDFECENEGSIVQPHEDADRGEMRGTKRGAGVTKRIGADFFLTTGADEEEEAVEGEVDDEGEGQDQRCTSVPPAEIDDEEDDVAAAAAVASGILQRITSLQRTSSMSASRSVSRSISPEHPEDGEESEVDEEASIPPTDFASSASNSRSVSRIPSMLSAYSASGADTDRRTASRGSMLSDLDAGKENNQYHNGMCVTPPPVLFAGALPPPTDDEEDEEEDYARYRRDNNSSRLSGTGSGVGVGTGTGTGSGGSPGSGHSRNNTSPIGIAIVKSAPAREAAAAADAPHLKNGKPVLKPSPTVLPPPSSASAGAAPPAAAATASGGSIPRGAGSSSKQSNRLASSTSSLSMSSASASQKFRPIGHRSNASSAHGSDDEYGSDFED